MERRDGTGGRNEKEGTTIRLWRIQWFIPAFNGTSPTQLLPTALHSSLPPLILEISNSSTVPSKFKPWLAIFFPLHIPPMIESVAFSFFLFSIQISLWSAFFFFFANNHPRGEDIRKINKQEVNAWIRIWIRTSIWNWFYLWREKKFLIMNTELWL